MGSAVDSTGAVIAGYFLAHCCLMVVCWRFSKSAENGEFNHDDTMNQSAPYAELIATFRRAEAEAAHKFGLIKTLSNKGPKAIQAAVDTADKAAKRRDSYAKKLKDLGVDVKELTSKPI